MCAYIFCVYLSVSTFNTSALLNQISLPYKRQSSQTNVEKCGTFSGIYNMNIYIILDGLEGDTRIYCPRC